MRIDYQDCIPCSANYHYECPYYTVDANGAETCCCPEENPLGVPEALQGEEGHGRTLKSDNEIKDRQSTGRKRAAEAYPLDKTKACEWRNLRFAGGGFNPIIGCFAGMQLARHHGPDKNTLNNEIGNVHRICATCHNRWHTINDPFYPDKFGTSDWKSHDPDTKVSYQDQLKNEQEWKKSPKQREIKDED